MMSSFAGYPVLLLSGYHYLLARRVMIQKQNRIEKEVLSAEKIFVMTGTCSGRTRQTGLEDTAHHQENGCSGRVNYL